MQGYQQKASHVCVNIDAHCEDSVSNEHCSPSMVFDSSNLQKTHNATTVMSLGLPVTTDKHV
jgi:hypothetical protein